MCVNHKISLQVAIFKSLLEKAKAKKLKKDQEALVNAEVENVEQDAKKKDEMQLGNLHIC